MPSDIIGPPLDPSGSTIPSLEETSTSPRIQPELEPKLREPSAFSSTSGDELTLSLSQARPDPLLGEFHSDELATVETVGQAAEDDDSVTGASRGEALAALGNLASDSEVVSLGPSSSEALASLGLSGLAPPRNPSPKAPSPPSEEEDDEDDEPASRGSSWATLLLASYASAVTLGLIWVLTTGRGMRDRASVDFPTPADARVDPGLRAERSRKVQTPEPIKAGSVTTIGKPLTLGLIEVTPIAVRSGRVTLERDIENKQTSQGGKGSLLLTLKFKNISDDTVIAPLDEAFIRERPGADPDSFIETGGAGPPVGMYSLALESEWSIASQTFRDLRPGESFETMVASAPDALAGKPKELTWRLRIRTNINHTEDMAVRFPADAVKPAR